VNTVFGTLSGLKPLLRPGSALAYGQVAIVLSIQFAMALLCCTWLPDADRLISRFMGTKFLLEAVATTVLFAAALGASPRVLGDPLDLAFHVALSAMAVPILQLVEQRCITPTYNVIYTHNCNVLALGAALYMLAMSLRRRLKKILVFIAGHEDDGDGNGENNRDGNAAENAAHEEEEEATTTAEQDGGVQLSGEQVDDAIGKVSKLAARALAAKEVASKQMTAPTQAVPGRSAASYSVYRSACASKRLVGQLQQQRAAVRVDDAVAEADGDGGDDDGDDDGGDNM